ncbi:MAG: hypothetical protein ACK4PR_02710, partial [Gammaproteobacteria bacterium]
MLILDKSNFVDIFQDMLQKYYLQPLDGSVKEKLQDGHLERIIYGAQHASQTAIWTHIIHGWLQEFTPSYVKNSLTVIAEYLKLSEEIVRLLTLISAALHNSGRDEKNARSDWQTRSSNNITAFLQEIGISENTAKIFANTVIYIDSPDKFKTELKQHGISEQTIYNFDYLRILIKLGNLLDNIRFDVAFQCGAISSTLSLVDGFNKESEMKFFELMKEVAQFTYEQSNMYRPCTWKEPGSKKWIKIPSNFSKKIKTKIEHADNVFSLLWQKTSEYSKFS